MLDIVIVNWNAGSQLLECLESINVACDSDVKLNRVVVVDNASVDGSLEAISHLTLPLTIIQNGENLGFGRACNQGALESKADFLLFLNPDTRLFPDSLFSPLQFLENKKNSKIGICGIQLVDETGIVVRTCARFPRANTFTIKMLGLDRIFPVLFKSNFMTEWDHNETMEVDQVMGAFFLIRRSLYDALGGFDERFFVYFEEVDISYRASKSGWKTIFLASAQVFHKGGGTSQQVKARRLFYSIRSRILYAFKHYHMLSATYLLVLTLLIEPLSRIIHAFGWGSKSQISETFIAYQMLLKQLPTMMLVALKRNKDDT
jgi:N-acetylglucosaminyl-diphospho-decaprenol L-rhamnosyltransferase